MNTKFFIIIILILFSCNSHNENEKLVNSKDMKIEKYYEFEGEKISVHELENLILSIKNHNFDSNSTNSQPFAFTDYATRNVFILNALTAATYLSEKNAIHDLYFEFVKIFESDDYKNHIYDLSVNEKRNTVGICFFWNNCYFDFAISRGSYKIYWQVIDITKSDLTFDDFIDGIDLSVGILYSGEQTSSPDGADEAEEY